MRKNLVWWRFFALAAALVVSDYWQAQRVNDLQVQLQIALYENRIILWETLWDDSNGDVNKAREHYLEQIRRLREGEIK